MTRAATYTPADIAVFVAILVVGLIVPFIAPAYTFQIAVLYLMVVFALTWDIMGGQMGYNSLGNIFFFGAGMYICAVVQIRPSTRRRRVHGPFRRGEESTSPFPILHRPDRWADGGGRFFLSSDCAIISAGPCSACAGPYFAIGTLGIAIAAGELVGAWDYVGGGGGMSLPVYPGERR